MGADVPKRQSAGYGPKAGRNARGDKPAAIAIAAAEAGLALEPKHGVCERVLAKARN